MTTRTKPDGAGYSSLDPALLCKRCQHGTIIESAQGDSLVLCTGTRRGKGRVLRMPFVVTKCSAFTDKEVPKLWAEGKMVKVTDDHCWVQDHYGRWIRADSYFSMEPVFEVTAEAGRATTPPSFWSRVKAAARFVVQR